MFGELIAAQIGSQSRRSTGLSYAPRCSCAGHFATGEGNDTFAAVPTVGVAP